MEQVHRRFTDDQAKALLESYSKDLLGREEIQEILGVGRSRFFALLAAYRDNSEGFTIAYRRTTPARIPETWEEGIRCELLAQRALVEDPELPVTTYNYSFIRDRLEEQGIRVSVPTIISRAKELGCYLPRRKRKHPHEREVITTAIGALIQHDASHHRWSPYAAEKWVLITSIDDFSRKLLYAEFFPFETTWSHIQAAETLVRTYGLPLCYYTDSLRVFRFVQGRDSFWRRHVLETDEANPQWKQVMNLLGIKVSYALSPQAKGKVERPYRWLQDRIVRTCALEKLSDLEDVRSVLRGEVARYNDHQVHSTTGEIPAVRFREAKRAGMSLFRPFAPPQPYTSPKDVFCLRETRIVSAYRKISLFGKEIVVPKVSPRDIVEVHLIPDPARGAMEIRLWCEGRRVHSAVYPLSEFRRVHF